MRFALLSHVAARDRERAPAKAGWTFPTTSTSTIGLPRSPPVISPGAAIATPSLLTIHNLAYQGVFDERARA